MPENSQNNQAEEKSFAKKFKKNSTKTAGTDQASSPKNDEPAKSPEQILQDQLKKLEGEKSELNDKNLRLLAEIDNLRRRSAEELEKSAKYAIANFASDLVTSIENFFLASANAPKAEIEKSPEIKNYVLAIEMTEKELIKTLNKHGIQRIFPLNEDFNHNFHEAISKTESELAENKVVQVIQAGYSINERLIRPALVVVSKTKS